MRIALAVLILGVMAMSGAPRTLAATSPAIALQIAPASLPGDMRMGATEIDLVKWGFTQGGLTFLLLVVLVSYRRDFFRKNEAKQAEIDSLREDKRSLRDVLKENANAMVSQALATQANTKATEQLAANVKDLADRRHNQR